MRFVDVVVPAEWASETLVHAEFSGDGAGLSPLTWAQRVMWRSIARNGANHVFLNLRRTVPVSARAGAEVPAVARAVGALVGRHGSLRTRVRVVGGEPRQETAAAGVLPLLVCVGAQDGAEAARDTAGRLGDVAFDHAAEWPLRVALVTVADRVRQVVVVFSHSTVDAHAAETVLRELRLIMLRGGLPTPAGPQSVDVARWQHDADRGRSARSIGHWLREWDRLPTPLPLPTSPLPAAGPGLTPPWRRGVLVSSAVDTATRLIAARHRVSGSAVLLAGVAAMATGRHERDRCGLFPMAHNRFRTEYANAVANLGQIGFGVLDLSGRPHFGELLSRVWSASLDGLRHAYYDPVALRHAFEERGVDPASAFAPHYYFNDVRLPVGGVDRVPAVTQDELRAATGRSTFSWTAGLDQASWHLLTHVVDEPAGVGVTLTVDTRHRTLDDVEPFLRGLEELLVEAAFHEVPWPWSPATATAAPTAALPVVAPPPATAAPATAPPVAAAPTTARLVVGGGLTYAEFHGGRDATAPLTWGQRAMWRTVAEFVAPAAYRVLTLPRTLAVSVRAGVDVPRAVRAVGALVARHESLRTRVRPHDGELCQQASAAGRLPVGVHAVPRAVDDPDGAAAAAELAAQLSGSPFDHAVEYPLRVALVTVDDRVRQIVLVFSHCAVDFHAATTVLRDLRVLLLRGSLDSPPGLQSLDLAARERTTGLRRSQRAVAYWVRQFTGLPMNLADPVGSGSTPRYRQGSLVSPAAHHAGRLVAARHGVSTSTVLVAATAAVLTGDGGQDACGIVVMANNRFPPGYDHAVATLNQIGLCRLDLADRPDFAELLSRAGRASLDAYRHAYYDPAEFERAFTDLGHDHRSVLAPLCYLNDTRLASEVDPGAVGPDEAALRGMVTPGAVRWVGELDRFAWRCRVQVRDAPGAVELVVTADTRYLPAERAERLLSGVEALLVEAAFHEVPWPWSPTVRAAPAG
ncbi:Condensation domain-containing protein [Micromonospora matsumotoense]|uniref:Condensation domain-containing protein n=1 Tax=Micromonospora matsumotoense TaxID=121616 RepID=A0A1C4XA15_9ACTN|nr:condensation domain-containing protein [Micromonospora matsumotoense]SCF05272.1 Condensation domain-containing protein [Micromonospora matsumotoense]